jgi:hypothetical protein
MKQPAKSAIEQKRNRIARNLAKIDERAEVFRAELKSNGYVNGSTTNNSTEPINSNKSDGGIGNKTEKDESL